MELPSPDENAAIEAAAATDPDAAILSDEEWQAALRHARRGGRPRSENPKIHTGIRLSPECWRISVRRGAAGKRE